jgi:hypothetical protein
VATTGLDGAIYVLDAARAGDSSQNPSTLCPPSPFRSYRSATWVHAQALAAVGTVDGVEVWDPRQPRRAVSSSPLAWCTPSEQLVAVAAQPSRPMECVVGHRSSAVSLWDLRFLAAPHIVQLEGLGSGGTAQHVACDQTRASGTSVPALVATTAGQLWSVDLGKGGQAPQVLCEEAASFTAMAVDDVDGGRVIACTDTEGLLVVDRGLPGMW